MPTPSFFVLTCFGMQFRQNQASHSYKGLQKLLDLFRMDLADQTWEGMLGLFGDPLTLNGAWQLLWGYLEVPRVLVSSHGIEQAVVHCLLTSSSGKWLAGSVPDSLSALCVEIGFKFRHRRQRGPAYRPSHQHRGGHHSSDWQ